ncbi:DUF559 domain-containing protein [Xylanibacillus composti]|uniref:DUF559 domain-containing protein n=1 Tax=Xylanibacillus composti TaxID=1572762 RepID=A0A8J4GZM4_9BACL|nr:DUF559 domain-containing protein [Xylanibacillus composti]GIQ68162.1 DUF559 domain-containing protein [Xylanibacillus composti]
MHPAVRKFVEAYEAEARAKGRIRTKIGKYELLFLEQVWGPNFDYRFDGLQAEYPFMDSKGGQRFIDFIYQKGEVRLLIEIDGYTTHARQITYKEFDDHLNRQNDLAAAGWHILRLSANQVEHQGAHCQYQLQRAIGACWSRTYGLQTGSPEQLWTTRKNRCLHLALQHEGKLKASLVAAEFGVTMKTAHDWMQRFVKEGMLIPIKGKKRIVGYQVIELLR